MPPIISIRSLTKTYASGFQALKGIDLDIHRGEIFALLGPNGAGKTTLISIICGIVNASSGTVTADGHDIVREARAARSLIGLVPQELSTDAFESVWATCRFSRGLYGKPPNPTYLEKVLRQLSLWDKRDSKILALSGGMKRRVLIAKALAHEPRILFLDEPTAGVDVELHRHRRPAAVAGRMVTLWRGWKLEPGLAVLDKPFSVATINACGSPATLKNANGLCRSGVWTCSGQRKSLPGCTSRARTTARTMESRALLPLAG